MSRLLHFYSSRHFGLLLFYLYQSRWESWVRTEERSDELTTEGSNPSWITFIAVGTLACCFFICTNLDENPGFEPRNGVTSSRPKGVIPAGSQRKFGVWVLSKSEKRILQTFFVLSTLKTLVEISKEFKTRARGKQSLSQGFGYIKTTICP